MKSYTNEVSRPQARWTSSHSVVSYFVLTFALSWTGALLVVMPWLVRREVVPKFTGLMIFPVMLLGPCIAGVTLTWISGGGTGLRSLWSRMRKFAVAPKWYAPLFIPPILIAGVLLFLRLFVSQTFASNFFLAGVGFGVTLDRDWHCCCEMRQRSAALDSLAPLDIERGVPTKQTMREVMTPCVLEEKSSGSPLEWSSVQL
jgi:hypothetical protein